MTTCERCGYRGWLYQFQEHRVCAACWMVAATEDAQARGEHRVNLMERHRSACQSVGHLLMGEDDWNDFDCQLAAGHIGQHAHDEQRWDDEPDGIDLWKAYRDRDELELRAMAGDR